MVHRFRVDFSFVWWDERWIFLPTFNIATFLACTGAFLFAGTCLDVFDIPQVFGNTNYSSKVLVLLGLDLLVCPGGQIGDKIEEQVSHAHI